jgi:hypothetical protein
MVPEHLYACIRRDLVWRIRGSHAELRESRTEQGHCLTLSRNGLLEIEASDDFSRTFSDRFTAPRQLAETLQAQQPAAEPVLKRLVRELGGGSGAAVRVLTTVCAVENERQRGLSVSTIATVRILEARQPALSITTDPAHMSEHLALLLSCVRRDAAVQVDYRRYPILWKNGSGAVLLHEAIGHPAETASFLEWPEWLEVRDDPSLALVSMRLDDTAQATSMRVLSGGETPSAFRRESFRQPPVRRMTNLAVASRRNVEQLPSQRIEVLLLGGGSYEAATELVRINISAARIVSGSSSRRVAPFQLAETRQSIRRVLNGSVGKPVTYPGVICGDEGQRLPVGAVAPDLLTEAFP